MSSQNCYVLDLFENENVTEILSHECLHEFLAGKDHSDTWSADSNDSIVLLTLLGPILKL